MAEGITDLNSENFDEFLKGERVVVDFWAPWCGPCKVMEPKFIEAAEELKDKVKFGKVNVDDNTELAQRFGVMSIPTTIFFDDKKQIDRASGALSKEDIVEKASSLFKK